MKFLDDLAILESGGNYKAFNKYGYAGKYQMGEMAMIDAGYSETYADRNSKYLLGIIGDEIKKAQENIKNDNIKSIEEVQQWWSEVMDDNEESTKNRLKASELLVKSKGGFIEKMEVTAKEDPFDKLKVEELRQLIDDD